jgi:hypothetical protein
MTVALWKLDGVSQKAVRIADVESNDDHTCDPGIWN